MRLSHAGSQSGFTLQKEMCSFQKKTLISKIVTTVVLCTNEDVRAERGTKQVVAIAMADVYSALCS